MVCTEIPHAELCTVFFKDSNLICNNISVVSKSTLLKSDDSDMQTTKRILINAANEMDEVRVAIMSDRKLIDLDIERVNAKQTKANIYKAKISRIEPSLEAIFVNYGTERHGFAPLKEISPEYFITQKSSSDSPKLTEALKVGQDLVIQVEKEERGAKGAALTTFISLAGSYLVLMPNNPRAGGISRQIDPEEREQLRTIMEKLNIPSGMSVIIRTAGVDKSIETLQWDLDILLQYWEAIKRAAIEKPGPYLIHQESDAIMRALRDHLRQDVTEIIIDDLKSFERAKKYVQTVRPIFSERVKYFDNPVPIFSYYQIERQIEQAYDVKVYLPSGGSIVIHPTEALVSIDVNSSHATAGKDIEETALNTNLEAAAAVIQQLRLRDAGGLIVIDFIDMTPSSHQRAVENALREAAKSDRARIRIGRISEFGLLEMSRQRLRSSLNRTIQINCPRCHGQGKIRTVQSLANSIVHVLQEQAAKSSDVHFEAQVPLEVAAFLTNEQRHLLAHIETLHNVQITIVPNTQLQTPNHYIKQLKIDTANPSHANPSYSFIEKPKTLSSSRLSKFKPMSAEPVIKRFLSDTLNKKSPRTASKKQSALKKFLHAVFGSDNAEKDNSSQQINQTTQRRTQPNRQRHHNTRRNYNNKRRVTRSRTNSSGRPSSQRRRTSSSASRRRYHNNKHRESS
jgi:ribonuclease E